MDRDEKESVEMTVGGARVESWLKGSADPGDQSTEAEPACMDKPARQRGRLTRATSMARKPKVKLLANGTDVETGARQTRATTEKPEGRRSPVEPKGWRVEAQL